MKAMDVEGYKNELRRFMQESDGKEKIAQGLEDHLAAFNQQLQNVREMFLGGDDDGFMPILVIFNPYGFTAIVGLAMIPELEESKELTETLILEAVEAGAIAVLFAAEAAAVVGDDYEKAMQEYEPGCIINNPDSFDVIHVFYTCAVGEFSAMAKIHRNPRLDTTLDDWDIHTEGLRGRFSDFWNKVRQRHADEN
jgi:hypothetical protein